MAEEKAKKQGLVIKDGKDLAASLKKFFKTEMYVGKKDIIEGCRVFRIPTSLPTIDYIYGGGILEGKISVFCGDPSSGKTTTAMSIVPSLQQRLKELFPDEIKFIYWSDPEGAWDPDYADALGIDQNTVIISRTKVLEDVFKEIDDLVTAGFVKVVIVDSIDGLVPKKTDDNAYANTMGSLSGALSAHLPNLNSALVTNRITTILIKQARVKMGVMGGAEVISISGGKAFQHFPDSIFIFKRLSNRDLNYTPVNIQVRKARSPRIGLTLMMPLGNLGIDKHRDLVNIAIMHGLIKPGGGGWIEWNGAKIQGTENFLNVLKSDKDQLEAFTKKVYEDIINTNVICKGEEAFLVEDE